MDTYEITTENVIPEGYSEARYAFDPETEVLLRVEELKEGMVVLVESMLSREDPKKAEDPNCSPYLIESLDRYQTWRRVSEVRRSSNNIVSWVGTDANGKSMSERYGIGHFFFVKKSSMPETYPQVYVTALQDLAKIIAQEKSGLTGTVPEQDDYALAMKFRQQIEEVN